LLIHNAAVSEIDLNILKSFSFDYLPYPHLMSFITVLSVVNALKTIKPGYFSMANLQQFIFVANIIIIVVLSAKKLIFYL